MRVQQCMLGTCEWNGLLYVIGGYDGASCLSSVERYDPLTLTWTSVAAMNLRRRYLRIAVLGMSLSLSTTLPIIYICSLFFPFINSCFTAFSLNAKEPLQS